MNSPSRFIKIAQRLPSPARIRVIGDFIEAKYPKRITPTKVVAAICGGDYRKFRTGYLVKLQWALERPADENFHCLPGIKMRSTTFCNADYRGHETVRVDIREHGTADGEDRFPLSVTSHKILLSERSSHHSRRVGL